MKRMVKNPPMGWNSWDCYGASVTEEEILGNARYMETHLKEYGWEYIVCDIQWYEPTADSSLYHKFAPLEMDQYGRLMPAVNRFPSAQNGMGFKPLADEIHKMGLKFGIHIMRGVPRQAVHAALPVKGTDVTCRDIAGTFSLCSWNTDMYGVDASAPGAQAYYDSIFELYASWGVDFVKVDDICVTFFSPYNLYSAKEEIEMIHYAIEHCGRDMVLSLSPGPAPLEQADHLSKFADMWRITNDYWDRFVDLNAMFERCQKWAPFVKEGSFPDCDMLPLGHIGIRSSEHGQGDRYTNFTKNEQRAMMTLWCIFRSPLMFGGELRDNDDWTNSLLTNKEVLSLLTETSDAREIYNNSCNIVWETKDQQGNIYLAFFNVGYGNQSPEISFERLGLSGKYYVRDLWKQQDAGVWMNRVNVMIPVHGVKLYRLRMVE